MKIAVSTPYTKVALYVICDSEVLYYNDPVKSWGSYDESSNTFEVREGSSYEVFASVYVLDSVKLFKSGTPFTLVLQTKTGQSSSRGVVSDELSVVKLCDIRHERIVPYFLGYKGDVMDWFDTIKPVN